MTRDETIEDISKGIKEAFPENVDLDADDLSTIEETVVPKVLSELTAAMDDAADDEPADQ